LVTKDPKAISAALSIKDHADVAVRHELFLLLAQMAPTEPSLFEPLAAATQDPDSQVRMWAMLTMGRFGKRGIPIVRKALRDMDPANQQNAICAAFELGPDGAELRPELLAHKNHADPTSLSLCR